MKIQWDNQQYDMALVRYQNLFDPMFKGDEPPHARCNGLLWCNQQEYIIYVCLPRIRLQPHMSGFMVNMMIKHDVWGYRMFRHTHIPGSILASLKSSPRWPLMDSPIVPGDIQICAHVSIYLYFFLFIYMYKPFVN